jgi:hypothetical protein
MNRVSTIVKGAVLLLVLTWGLWITYKWTAMRVYVPHDKALLVVAKYGKPLPPGRIVVPHGEEGNYKGVHESVLGPGRYFINPVFYDTEEVDLVSIPAGDPQKWEWDPDGNLKSTDAAPKVGLVTVHEGLEPAHGQEVVDAGEKGVQRDVLTPGTYKINPRQKRVDMVPAVVVPPGSVGVVTRLIGDVGGLPPVVASAPLSLEAAPAPATGPASAPAGPASAPAVAAAAVPTTLSTESRIVMGATQRGVLRVVLQPGIYYLNPRMAKVTVMPIGYDEVSLEAPKNPVRFLSSDGYQILADLTVVWGRTPADAPSIVATIGTTDDVRLKVVEQAVRAACQNEGANFSAQDLIQGATRENFVDALSASLSAQLEPRNIHVLLALIRNIEIKDARGADQTQGLLATIQQANIQIEKELTNRQKTLTATTAAQYEEALKLVDVAREEVSSETNVKVANILATGQKKAAEIEAAREVQVATIEQQVAALDAQRTQIAGRAQADVDRLKNEAEAKGAKLMVDAFGSPAAYNQYIFAKNFQPQELRLIFAGPGTFWTDLKSFQDIGASKVLEQQQGKPAPNP